MDIKSGNSHASRVLLLIGSIWIANAAAQAQTDDTSAFKSMLRRANGGVLQLDPRRVYHLREKIQLNSLCPKGVAIEGKRAVLKALPGFRHGVLLTATNLLRDDPYTPGVTVRNLTLDGNGQVGRCVFGNWKNAQVHNLRVRGGTVYQVNAIWHDTMLSNLRILGNASQTDNGFDCNLQNSTIWNIRVDMQGNLKESAFWLNGCNQANVINAYLKDGRTAFGLENCKDVNVINMRVRGKFSFRVVNILPAKASERIHLYDVDLEPVHVGADASAGVHFNATKGGMVARGKVRTPGPGVLLTHAASDINVINVDLPSRSVHPTSDWTRIRPGTWMSKRHRSQGQPINKPPVVCAGPDRITRAVKNVLLRGVVADERNLDELNVAWSKKSGPGGVKFHDARSLETRVTFSVPGIYTLLLAASDGELQAGDEVIVKAIAAKSRT